MSASCIITSLSFILLLATICCELIAFLTSHVISNNFDSRLHEGIYQRCGMPFNSILGSQTNIGSYFGFTPACSWWNSRMFDFDPGMIKETARSSGNLCLNERIFCYSFASSSRHFGIHFVRDTWNRLLRGSFKSGR